MRSAFFILIVLDSASWSTPAAEAAPDIVKVRDLLDAYQKKYDQISTIGIKYTEVSSPVIPPEILFREYQTILWGNSLFEEIHHRDGRLFYREETASASKLQPFYDRLEETYPQLAGKRERIHNEVPFGVAMSILKSISAPPQPRRLVFDGDRLWQHRERFRYNREDGSQQICFTVVDPTRLRNRYIPPTIIEHFLYAFDTPGLSSEREFRTNNRFPGVTSGLDDNSVLDARETVDGIECIVLTQSTKYRFMFDPQLSYTLKKRQWIYDDRVVFEVTGHDFEEVGDDIWLPRRVTTTTFASDGNRSGTPLYRSVFHVSAIEINRPNHEAYFTLSVPAGAVVIDETRRPVNADGESQSPMSANVIPSVAYTQPANEAEVEKVAAAASLQQGELLAQSKKRRVPIGATVDGFNSFRMIAIWFNVGLIASLLALLAYRKHSRRSLKK